MHPVLGTMMPEICEAPHLLYFPSSITVHHYLMGWDVFITFPLEMSSAKCGIPVVFELLYS